MNKSVQWFLVSNCGLSVPLPQTMISLGRDGCDVVLQSRSVDKRHAVITYDHYEKRFKVKDLNSINGTYLNSVRIPSQAFVKLEHLDSLRFAFDAAIYQVQVVERIPQFAINHCDYRQAQPPWSTHPYPQSHLKMAECQGCLHKQTVQHTCGMKGGATDWQQQPQQQLQPSQHQQSNHQRDSPHATHHMSSPTSATHDQQLSPSHNSSPTQSAAHDYCGNIVQPNKSDVPFKPNHDVNAADVTPLPPTSASSLGHSVCHASDYHQYSHQMAPTPPPCSCSASSSAANLYRQVAQSHSGPNGVCIVDNTVTNRMQSPSQQHKGSVGPPRVANGAMGDPKIFALQNTFSGDSLDSYHAAQSADSRTTQGIPADVAVRNESNCAVQKGTPTSQGIVSVMEAEKPYSQTNNDAVSDLTPQSNGTPCAESARLPPPSDGGEKDDRPITTVSPTPGDATRSEDERLGDGSLDISGAKTGAASFPTCTAFTVDFTDNRPLNKRLDIRDSISKFAPPKVEAELKVGHRRNQSLSKVEEYKTTSRETKKEKESDFSIGITLTAAKARLLATAKGMRGGYLSEGHVSSDQDDDFSSKSDPTKKPIAEAKSRETPTATSATKASTNKTTHEFSPLETPGSRRSLPVAGLRDSAKYLISKMFGEVVAPPASPTDPPSPLYLPLATSNTARPAPPPGHHVDRHPTTKPGQDQVEFPLTKNEAKSGSRSSLTSNTTYTVDGREFGNAHTLPRPSKARPTDLAFARGEADWVAETLSEGEDSDDMDEAVPTAGDSGSPQDELEGDDGGENASEAGTYTIEKDDKGEEETEARRNIDAVFGVTGDYSVRRVCGSADDDDDDDDVVCDDGGDRVELRHRNSDLAAIEDRVKSCNSRKGNPSWLKEWVTQAANGSADASSATPSPPDTDNNLGRMKANFVGTANVQHQRPLGMSPVVAGTTPPNNRTPDGLNRPRRKLPVLPVDKTPLGNHSTASASATAASPVALLHPTSHHTHDAASPSERPRKSSSSSRTSPEGRRSDSSMDTETILRDTETVVTAMEARMVDSRRQKDSGVSQHLLDASSSIESRDSGGESDNEDTSAASGGGGTRGGTRQSLNKKLSEQLKMQLRLLEQDAGSHHRSGTRGSSARANANSGRTELPDIQLHPEGGGSGGHHRHGKVTPTGVDYVDNLSELETASLHSDVSTSSDLSGSSPGGSGKRKGGSSSDHGGAPLMRFNRAFSLRRARLGCSVEPPVTYSSSPKNSVPIQKVVPPSSSGPPSTSRPSSAGSVNSSRDRGWRSSTSNRSDSGASAASGSRSAPPPPPASNSLFSRSDGGRFSLRLPRSAPIPVRPPSGKASPQHPVAPPRKNAALKAAGSQGTARAGHLSVATPAAARSNSTLSAKELEMKNWKRRKTYDPLKAAAEGRRKDAVKKVGGGVLGGTMHGSLMSKSESPSPTTGHFQRSASFHGTPGLANNCRNAFGLRDDGDDDDDAEHAFSDDNAAQHDRHDHHHHQVSDVAPTYDAQPDVLGHDHIPDDGFGTHRGKKSSEDESTSEATRTYSHTDLTNETFSTSPRGSPMLHSVHRHKSKIDALDNLVISTIHQLSSNLSTNADFVLKKLCDVHSHECEQTLGNDGLQDLLRQLSHSESPVSSPQAQGVSKQLSGILKNMKRLEESLQVVNKVLAAVPATDAHHCPAKCNGDIRRTPTEKTSHHTVANKAAPTKWNGFKSRDYY